MFSQRAGLNGQMDHQLILSFGHQTDQMGMHMTLSVERYSCKLGKELGMMNNVLHREIRISAKHPKVKVNAETLMAMSVGISLSRAEMHALVEFIVCQ